jgi:hypothetical protein
MQLMPSDQVKMRGYLTRKLFYGLFFDFLHSTFQGHYHSYNNHRSKSGRPLGTITRNRKMDLDISFQLYIRRATFSAGCTLRSSVG